MKTIILVLITILVSMTSGFAGDTTIIKNYDNGNIKSSISYKDGIKNGKSTFYDTTGILQWSFNYKSGVPNDTAKYFYDNGNLYDVTIYKDGTFVERTVYNNDSTVESTGIIEQGKCIKRDSTKNVVYIKNIKTSKYCN